MKVTIEIDSENEMEKLSALLKAFDINAVNVSISDDNTSSIVRGDKSIDPRALFGIWSKKPRSIENIRKDAWERKNSANCL